MRDRAVLAARGSGQNLAVRRRGRRGLAGPLALGLLASALVTSPVWAGGYDTPMLYSARHMGMGGTAIAAVEDPSALFHNPAGLGHVKCFAALGDLSLLLARIRSSPNPFARDIESEQTVAPMFLVGAAHRLTNWLTAGLGVYPIASAGATYKYPSVVGTPIEDTTRLVFIEISPAVAVNLLDNRLRLGAGYRITSVSLERFIGDKTTPGAQPGMDFNLKGWNFEGFRVGAQYSFTDFLSAGLVYRHKTQTKVENDSGRAVSMDFRDVSTEFLLPSKLGAGVRADLGDAGLALDGEYLFNSQNEGFPLRGTLPPADPNVPPVTLEVANRFEWSDEVTVRAGFEYRLLDSAGEGPRPLALRAGYVFDSKTTNEQYPSAFGTPPGPTHVVTGGAGWRAKSWQINLAYAYRFGEGDVTMADLTAPGRKPCAFCGAAGDKPYKIAVHGIYLDLSYTLD